MTTFQKKYLLLSALFSFLYLTATTPCAAVAPSASVDFTRDIRPIFASNCLKCHGVDDKTRKGNLRLDMRDSAITAAKSGDYPIVPGKPDQSTLIRRINSADPDEHMPPPASKLTLTDEQKSLLKRWIAEGANYQPHWAFVAPRKAEPPAVKQADWCRNSIDRFVLAKLEQQGRHPSAEADKLMLVRRVYLDLIGLPPTPDEADAFAKDPSPDAYEKLVDRLLASPHYGERWARRWLDLARYADTNGYEKDRARSIWPYRDWVINSLNADMPFDEFTIEQIAGDMLPNATVSQKIATGFHRNTMLNEEGGIDPLEYRYYAMVDRVNTTGTAWLGLTIACAQCHTHKYDPIKNNEYYGFMALLNNADEPVMDIPTPDIVAHRREVDEKVATLTADLPHKFPLAAGNVQWEIVNGVTGSVTTASGAAGSAADDGSWRFTGAAPQRDTYTFSDSATAQVVDRIRLETFRDGKFGPGMTPHGNFVLSRISVAVADNPNAKPTEIKLVRAEADFSQASFAVEHAIDGIPASGWGIDGPDGIKSRTATFYFDKPVHMPRGSRWTIKLEQNYGLKHVIGHLRLSLGVPTSDDRPIDVRRQEVLEQSFKHWEPIASSKAVAWTVLRPSDMKSSKPILTLQKDGSILAGGDITKSDTYDLTFPANLKGITALRVEALPDDSLPRHGPGMIYYEGPIGDFCLSEISMAADGKAGKFVKAAHSYASGQFTAAAAIDGNPQTGWMIDGGQGRAHQAVFALAEPTADAHEVTVHMLFERHFAPALGHFRISVTTDPRAAADPQAMPPDVEAALATPAADRTAEHRDRIFRHYLEVAPELAEARKEIDQLRRSVPQPPTTLVMSERAPGHDRATEIHHRGEYLNVEGPAQPDVPAFLPPLPAGAAHNRLALARWLVSPENPLTARVTVNRQWQAFFGRGIVATMGDFGYQGDLPTHQDLLDWMAVEFMKPTGCNWSLKKLHRLIVTSATYRQSSRATPELIATDPQNLLLARGPRFRVEAEILRDAALRESGLLSEKIGGPSVFPPQPASVTTEGAYGPMQWNASTGEDRYRRSLYTFAKRTAPFAMYAAFDAPAGDVCTGRREVSNSPLQALTMMNDAVFMECAQALGKRISEMQDVADESRATAVFRQCLTRPAQPEELSELVAFAKGQRARFKTRELNAAEVAGGSDGNTIERATWTTVARAVLNLDEAITKN